MTASESQPPLGETLVRILKGSVAAGASDVHMRAGHAPIVRLEVSVPVGGPRDDRTAAVG